jgi:thioredoxin 1
MSLNSVLNRLMFAVLCIAAFYYCFMPKDYGPPPEDPWFRSAVIKQSGPVLVKFGATWCGPCRAVDAELTTLSETGPVQVVKIDVDAHRDLARHYGVTAIPRMLLFKDGKVVGDRKGYASADDLRSWIAQHSQ